MTVRWTPTALSDLEHLHAYVAEDNTAAATATVDRIAAGIEALKRHPEMGRKGRVAGTRELVAPPYVVAYRHQSAAIEILAVIHGARKWLETF